MKNILSIVPVVYNSPQLLQKTIDNIEKIKTTYDIEYVVIDGGSSDGTLNVIEEHDSVIDHWISEKDNGIYNAMNKAINLTHSKWCLFLNAGDLIIETSIESLLHSLEAEQKAVLCYGGFNQVFKDHTVEKTPKMITSSESFILANPICHQATFYRREYFNKLEENLFDENYKLISDQVTLFKISSNSIDNIKALNLIICNYDTNGVSAKFRDLVNEERIALCRKLLKQGIIQHKIKWNFKINKMILKSVVYKIMVKFNLVDFYRSFKKLIIK